MRKQYVFTAEEFAELDRIRAGADRVAGEMEALFKREPFPRSDEIACTFGVGRATLMIAADDLRRLIKHASEVHNVDLLDGLTECGSGPHFYDPDDLPGSATDRDYCSECQPGGGPEK